MSTREPLMPHDGFENLSNHEKDQIPSSEAAAEKSAARDNLPEKSTLSEAEKEIIRQENYYFSQKAAWEEFNKLSMDPKEAEAWFNDKYAKNKGQNNTESLPILLRDGSGKSIGEFKFEDIAPYEKAAHSFGTLKLIGDDYNLNFIKHFNNEPELLAIMDKKLSTLSRLVELYKENQDKLASK